jgi:adenylate kinase
MACLQHFDYGELLLRRKERQGSVMTYDKLREESASVIGTVDVVSTDEWVIAEIAKLRIANDIIIDSHALTREEYGFRAIPYSTRQLEALKFDAILTLRCDPDVLIARVAADRGGRRELSVELAREIQTLQEALCLHYAVACACPAFIIDTSLRTQAEVREVALHVLKGIGANIRNLECPVFYVPVLLRETGHKGADDGEGQEAYC